ncbi:MAG: hypothetical protein ACRC3Z_07905 [Phocaeicola sp.]
MSKGGERPGSGRRCIKEKKHTRLHIKLTQEAYDMLDWYSIKIGISKSDLFELWVKDNCSDQIKKGV